MPTLPLKTFSQLVSDQQASLQASNPDFVDLTPGSPLLALIEANAGVALYMQYLVYRGLRNTRLATSEGADLDDFCGQFLFGRYPSTAATGIAQFTRFASLTKAVVPVGSLLRTTDATLSFQVIADQTNPLFNPTTNNYEIAAGVPIFNVLVQSVLPGLIGNIQSHTLTRIASTLIGISRVDNPAPFINGIDIETDASFRSRFQSYINSRSRGTLKAIDDAILNTQPGITYTIQENVAADGSLLPGNLLIYYDDGTGKPTAGLTKLVATNIEAVRSAGISFSLAPANPMVVSIFLSTRFAAGFNKTLLVGNLALAIELYINSIPVGQNLIYTRLYQIIYENAPGLVEATGLLINGVAGDLQISLNQVARFIPAISIGGPGSVMTID